jgi:predicted amidohydrolase
MPRNVKITAIQIPNWVTGNTAKEKYESNLKNIDKFLDMAGKTGCDLTGIGEDSNIRNLSNPEADQVLPPLLDGPEVKMGARLAKKHNMNIVLGIAGIHEGKKRNAGVLVNRSGKVAGVYHKVQLTRGEKLAGYIPGDDFPVFKTDFGKIGIVICHDLSFIESTRVLGVRGAEVIVWPSNWSGWGRDLSLCLMRARAIDNSAYLVFLSSGQNPEKPLNMMAGVCGCTCIISTMGEIIAQVPQRIPGIVSAEVDLDDKRIAHGFTYDRNDVFIKEMLCERRPDAYGPLSDPSLVPPPPREYPVRK